VIRIEPASPALQGGFLTTGPPGKLPDFVFLWSTFSRTFPSVISDVLKVPAYIGGWALGVPLEKSVAASSHWNLLEPWASPSRGTTVTLRV